MMMRFPINRPCAVGADDRGQLLGMLVALSLVFLLNPLLGTLTALCYAFVSRNRAMAPFLVVAVAGLMWCLQSTRSFHFGESSDWAGNYCFNFRDAGRTDVLSYLFLNGKEYAWQLFNLVGYHLFYGRFLAYGNFIVALTYGFTLAAVYRFWRHTQTDVRYLVVSLCLFAFVPEVNGLSNNLLRQQFAMSMMLYVLVERATTGRICYLLMLTACFTHTMTGLFVPVLFLPLGQKASLRFYGYLLLGFAVLYVLLTHLSVFAAFGDVYAFQRLSTASAKYTLKDVMFTSAIYPFLAVTAVLYVKAFFWDRDRQPCELYVTNVFLLLICLCLLMTAMPLLQIRYFITRFFFIPLVVPYFFTPREHLSDYYLVAVPLVFVFRFFATPSAWLAPFSDTLCRSLFDYL